MNGKKAKALRKIVFQGQPSPRKYVRLKSTGQIINIGDIEELKDDITGKIKQLPKRRIYKHLKRLSRGVARKDLQRTFLNDNKKVQEPNAS